MAADKNKVTKPGILSRGAWIYYVPAVFAAVAVALFASYADWQRNRLNEDAARNAVIEHLNVVKMRLQSDINRNVALVQGLTETVAENPQITQEKFAALAKRILVSAPQVHNVAVAPDLKITMVYPVAGNEKAIGLDYNKNEAQRAAALRVETTRRTLITGPVKLIQGGTGLIARYPVLTDGPIGTKRFWGIVSAVMDLDKLYEDSGLAAASTKMRIAIASRGPAEQQFHPFFGDDTILSYEPVSVSIDLGYDKWTLYAAPFSGWANMADKLIFRLILLSVALILVAPLLWAGKLMADRQRHVIAIQAREDQLAELSHRLELALTTSKIGVWEYDISASALHWDKRMRDLYDIPRHKDICDYLDWRNALHPDDLEEAERIFDEAIHKTGEYSTGFRVIWRNGEIHHIRAFGTVYEDAAGHKKIIGVNWDVTEDIRLQDDLREAKLQAETQNKRLEDARFDMEWAALHDSLTGLANRRYLDKVLQDMPSGVEMTVLHLDLDRFKEINDTFGHAAGDEILREAANVLRQNLYVGDFLARIGGDEFVVVSGPGNGKLDYRCVAARLIDAMARPFTFEGHECRLGASIGLAAANTAIESPGQLLINADIALYEAKRNGRNRVEAFTDNLRQVALNTKRTADDILRALENDQFVAFYQPQFDANTYEINGFEALVRWQHPTKGIIGPDSFLKVAENLRVVSKIDGIVLNQAHAQFMRMLANGIEIPKFSVNISAQRLKDNAFFDRLKEIAFKPGSLSVELLESISFETDDKELLRQTDQLKEMGVDIEIDDFGTGRASILTLLKLMPRRLKIDRQIVFPIVTSTTQRALVRSIIDIGRSRNIEIIAEGVETFEHAQILRDLGCHSLQGYAFARPMSGGDFIDFAKARAWFPKSGKAASAKV